MAGDEEAEDLFFRGEALMFIPVGNIGEFLALSFAFLCLRKYVEEQPVLSHLGVPASFLCPCHDLVYNKHELGPVSERIHGAALDQRLQYAFVQQPQVYLLRKFENIPILS